MSHMPHLGKGGAPVGRVLAKKAEDLEKKKKFKGYLNLKEDLKIFFLKGTWDLGEEPNISGERVRGRGGGGSWDP